MQAVKGKGLCSAMSIIEFASADYGDEIHYQRAVACIYIKIISISLLTTVRMASSNLLYIFKNTVN